MGGVGRNDEYFPVLFGDEGGKTAAGGGFAYSSLASYEDPSESGLFNNISECSFVLALHNDSLLILPYKKIFFEWINNRQHSIISYIFEYLDESLQKWC